MLGDLLAELRCQQSALGAFAVALSHASFHVELWLSVVRICEASIVTPRVDERSGAAAAGVALNRPPLPSFVCVPHPCCERIASNTELLPAAVARVVRDLALGRLAALVWYRVSRARDRAIADAALARIAETLAAYGVKAPESSAVAHAARHYAAPRPFSAPASAGVLPQHCAEWTGAERAAAAEIDEYCAQSERADAAPRPVPAWLMKAGALCHPVRSVKPLDCWLRALVRLANILPNERHARDAPAAAPADSVTDGGDDSGEGGGSDTDETNEFDALQL
jgi:hypothetical protein